MLGRVIAALRDPRSRTVLRGALYVAGAAALVGIYLKSVKGTLDRNDGYDYYVAARALLSGEDPSAASIAEIGYITYPPSAVLFFAPFAALGHTGFAVVWNALNAALVLVIPALALGAMTGRVRGHPVWWYLLPALASFRILETNATLSQSNLVIGAWCMLGIYFLRRARPGWAGLAIAVGAAIKVTPGLFGVYFLWRRRWGAAAAAAGGAILFFGLLPALVHGPRELVRQYETWRYYANALVNPPPKQYDYAHGQSVKSAMLRLLTKSNARKPGKGPYYVNVLELDAAAVKRVAPALSLAVLAVLLAVCRNPVAPREAPGPYLEMGLVLVAMLLMSPYVRKAHYAVLYPAVCLSTAALLADQVPRHAGRRLKQGLVVFAVGLNATAPAIITKDGSEFFNGVCIFVWLTLLFGVALAIACVACRRSVASAAPAPSTPTELAVP